MQMKIEKVEKNAHKLKKLENISYFANIFIFTDVISVIFDVISVYGKLYTIYTLKFYKTNMMLVNLSLTSKENR